MVVVIPVHSAAPKETELIAFDQCFKILSKYDIALIHPEGLDLTVYTSRVSTFKSIPISRSWFESHLTYNLLKRSLHFYDLFKSYTYLLTYELDCFVFRDELSYWCSRGYDYIGAPWFDNYTGAQNKIVGVGNSGFSLRNVQTCRKILMSNRRDRSLRAIVSSYFKSGNFVSYKLNLINLFKKIKYHSSFYLYQTFKGHEDAFWCIEIPKYFPEFRIASVDEAYKFSMEEQPEYLVNLNKGKLPFGIHAWYRFDYWKPTISKLGYNV